MYGAIGLSMLQLWPEEQPPAPPSRLPAPQNPAGFDFGGGSGPSYFTFDLVAGATWYSVYRAADDSVITDGDDPSPFGIIGNVVVGTQCYLVAWATPDDYTNNVNPGIRSATFTVQLL